MATINKKFVPIEAIHPTELIEDELKARGMRRKELAERLGMKASDLGRFLCGKGSITPSMALSLEKVFGIPADYWMRLQVCYERDIEAICNRNKKENPVSVHTHVSKYDNRKGQLQKSL